MSKLNLIEIYESIQGETTLTGLPTTFIRTAQCNLRCVWCDTPYSFSRGTPTPLDEIFRQVNHFGHQHVCITGGEPLLHKNVLPLMKTLCDLNYIVSLETGGSLPIDNVDPRVKMILDIKCPGSGMEEKNRFENLQNIRSHDEIKFVILDEKDYSYAKKVISSYSLTDKTANILFSPVFEALDPKLLINWILKDKLPVRISLQVHKYVWSKDAKGV